MILSRTTKDTRANFAPGIAQSTSMATAVAPATMEHTSTTPELAIAAGGMTSQGGLRHTETTPGVISRPRLPPLSLRPRAGSGGTSKLRVRLSGMHSGSSMLVSSPPFAMAQWSTSLVACVRSTMERIRILNVVCLYPTATEGSERAQARTLNLFQLDIEQYNRMLQLCNNAHAR